MFQHAIIRPDSPQKKDQDNQRSPCKQRHIPTAKGAASAVVALTAAVGGLFAIAAGVGSVIILKEI